MSAGTGTIRGMWQPYFFGITDTHGFNDFTFFATDDSLAPDFAGESPTCYAGSLISGDNFAIAARVTTVPVRATLWLMLTCPGMLPWRKRTIALQASFTIPDCELCPRGYMDAKRTLTVLYNKHRQSETEDHDEQGLSPPR
jgi:hypothetical protein